MVEHWNGGVRHLQAMGVRARFIAAQGAEAVFSLEPAEGQSHLAGSRNQPWTKCNTLVGSTALNSTQAACSC